MSEIPKKILIPIIVAAILIICLIGGLVYRSTSSSPFKEEEVQQTIAPTTQAVIETKVASGNASEPTEEFNIPQPVYVKADENGEVVVDEEAVAKESEEFESMAESLAVLRSEEAAELEATQESVQELAPEESSIAESEAIEEYKESLSDRIEKYTVKPGESAPEVDPNAETLPDQINPGDYADSLQILSDMVHEDALAELRETIKLDLQSINTAGTDLEGITPEMIDSYSEDELMEVYGKVMRAVRGY